jgi:hypothetical protein
MLHDHCISLNSFLRLVLHENYYPIFKKNFLISEKIPSKRIIRQSISLPSKPIVVFTDSTTPNWRSDASTKSKKPSLDETENKAFQSIKKPLTIVTELNKDIENRFAPHVTKMLHTYKFSGMQLWVHELYEKYKCFGPYVPNWQGDNVSWHPSVLGHELFYLLL